MKHKPHVWILTLTLFTFCGLPAAAGEADGGNGMGGECPSGFVAAPFVASGIPGPDGDQPVLGFITGMAPYVEPFVKDDVAGEIRFLYLADVVQSAIYRVRWTIKEGRQVTLFAGRPNEPGFADDPPGDKVGVARFDHPVSVTVDRGGNLYVADFMNGAVRKIYSNNGRVTTIAQWKDSAPIGVAYGRMADGEKIAVADWASQMIRITNTGSVILDGSPPPAEEMIPFSFGELRSIDWSEKPDDPPISGLYGEIVVGANTGVYRVYKSDPDGAWTIEQMADDPNVRSVFRDDKGHIYYVTEDNQMKFIKHRENGRYDPPTPLVTCGPALGNATAVAAFFGDLMVASRTGDSTQLGLIEPEISLSGWINGTPPRGGIIR